MDCTVLYFEFLDEVAFFMDCTVLYFEFLDEAAVLFLMVQFFVVDLRLEINIK